MEAPMNRLSRDTTYFLISALRPRVEQDKSASSNLSELLQTHLLVLNTNDSSAEKIIALWKAKSEIIFSFVLSEKMVTNSFNRFMVKEASIIPSTKNINHRFLFQSYSKITKNQAVCIELIATMMISQLTKMQNSIPKEPRSSARAESIKAGDQLTAINLKKITEKVHDLEQRIDTLYQKLIYDLEVEELPGILVSESGGKIEPYDALDGIDLETSLFETKESELEIIRQKQKGKSAEIKWLKKIEIIKMLEHAIRQELVGTKSVSRAEYMKLFAEQLMEDPFDLYSKLQLTFEEFSQFNHEQIYNLMERLSNETLPAEKLNDKFYKNLPKCLKKDSIESLKSAMIECYEKLALINCSPNKDTIQMIFQRILDQCAAFDPHKTRRMSLYKVQGGTISLEQILERQLNKARKRIEQTNKKADSEYTLSRLDRTMKLDKAIRNLNKSNISAECIEGISNYNDSYIIELIPKSKQELFATCRLLEGIGQFSISINLEHIEQIEIKEFLQLPERTRKRITAINFSNLKSNKRPGKCLIGISKILDSIESLILPELVLSDQKSKFYLGLMHLEYLLIHETNLSTSLKIDSPKLTTIRIEKGSEQKTFDYPLLTSHLKLLTESLKGQHSEKNRVTFILSPFDEQTRVWAREQIENFRISNHFNVTFQEPMAE